jgi:hypothetical protein
VVTFKLPRPTACMDSSGGRRETVMTWVHSFGDWYERLPGWAGLLLFPFVALLMLAYSLVALPVLLFFVLPYMLIFGGRQVASPAANFTRSEVHANAQSLNRWFADTLAEDPDASDCLGVGPGLAKQLAELAGQTEVTPEEAGLFAERVGRELKGYKGTPFFALHHLSRRLAELAKSEKAAMYCSTQKRA